MKEILEKLLSGSFVAEIMLVVVALNIFLIGWQGAVEKAQDLIPGNQSGFLKVLKSVLSLLGKVIDMAGMNKQHKKW